MANCGLGPIGLAATNPCRGALATSIIAALWAAAI
jgi:hypothetical protein